MATGSVSPPVGLGWMMPTVAPSTWASVPGGWIRHLMADALGAGIRIVHLGADPSTLARLPLVLAAVRDAPEPIDILLVVGPPPRDPPPPSGAPPSDLPTPPSPKVRWHVELPWGLLELPEGNGWPEELESARHRGRIRSWGVGVSTITPPAVQMVLTSAGAAQWVRGPYHLLSDRGSTDALATLADAGVPVMASDPFASGRLDGRFLAESYLGAPVRSRVQDVERLKSDWAPVLRLGFLTRSDRTLPAASLAFLRDQPGITAVLVDARDAGELGQASRAWSGPSLTPEERRRVDLLRA